MGDKWMMREKSQRGWHSLLYRIWETNNGRHKARWETNDGRHRAQRGGHSPWHRTWETNDAREIVQRRTQPLTQDMGDKWCERIVQRRTQSLTEDMGDKWWGTNDGRHRAQGGGHSPWHRTWGTNDRGQMMGDTEPREADTAPDTGHGRQMMGDTEPREADIAPDTRRTHLKIELSTPTKNCLGKKCTPLWREAYLEVKSVKTHHYGSTLENWWVEKVHAVVARSTFGSQKRQNTPFSDHFWTSRCCPDVEKVYVVVARSTCPSQKG